MISLRRRLTRDLLLALAVLLGAGLIALGVTVRRAVVDAFDATLRAHAQSVSALTEVEDGKVNFDFSPDFLRDYGGRHPGFYFELWDATGVLARSPSLDGHDLPSWTEGTPTHPRLEDLVLPNGRHGRAIGFRFAPQVTEGPAPEPVLAVRLVLAGNRHELNETLRTVWGAVAACGGLLLAAVLLVVPPVLRRGLAPLDQLGDRAANIDATTLAARFPSDGLPAELRPIAGRLNDLLARLEASFERERRFGADLAHELRTPLAELRTLAESALTWPESRDPATDRDTLAIAQQMQAIVTHLLALARGDLGLLDVRCEVVALHDVVREVWRTFAARAEERGIHTSITLAPATVEADTVLLRSILANLFDNLVAYAPSGTEATIAVDPDGTVRIANAAPGVAASDVEKLFDRFWRKEAARSGGQNFGLGLALACSYAHALGWTLTARLDDVGRLEFTLRRASGAPKPPG